MGEIRKPNPVLFFVAAFSRSSAMLEAAKGTLIEAYGPICRESTPYTVDEYTDYYEKEMGSSLIKRFWAFDRLIDPGDLAAIKCRTNQWEEEYAARREEPLWPEAAAFERPLNLDPGYVDLGKFVLASTKDHGHRIYLSDGIFAEITLSYSQKKWQALPWSYRDYQNEQNQEFLTECREILHQKRKKMTADKPSDQ